MAKVTHEPVKKAMSRVRELSADEEARRMAFVRERALRDEVSLLNQARREGEQKGEASVLLRLIECKFGPEAAEAHRERIERSDAETLLEWSERILTADHVEEIFHAA